VIADFGGRAVSLTLRWPSATPPPMADKFKVAAIQMTSTDDVESNLRTALRWSSEAIAAGARLCVLP